jgi:hypothetical protein
MRRDSNVRFYIQKCAEEEIMKRILLLLLTGCLLTILGCAGAQVKTEKNASEITYPITGKYFNPLTTDIYLELKDDGTFYDQFGKKSLNGTYVRDGNRVIFTLETGRTFECTLEGKSLITKEGSRFTKQ